MFDMHYDLLTKLYICYKENDFSYIEKWIKNYNSNNVNGLIANLCFESIDEMKEEYHEDYYNSSVSVVEMFKIVSSLLEKYLPNNIYVLKSIEGLDFVSIDDIYTLKQLGLNAVLPVWNNKNIYASGNRSNEGLTSKGEELIDLLVKLNIGIDLSHANQKSFFDIIDLIKEYRKKGIKPIIYASHSNTKSLCDIPRNLSDNQILALKEVDGYIGLISHSNFTLKNSIQKKIDLYNKEEYEEFINELKHKYLEHILYAQQLMNDINHIVLSTDDMGFSKGSDLYSKAPIFNYNNIKNELYNLLKEHYNEEDYYNILFGNAYHIYKELNNKEYTRILK